MAKDPQLVLKKRGARVPVVLGDEVSEQLLDELDELEAHLDFEAAQASGEIPLSSAESTARRKAGLAETAAERRKLAQMADDLVDEIRMIKQKKFQQDR